MASASAAAAAAVARRELREFRRLESTGNYLHEPPKLPRFQVDFSLELKIDEIVRIQKNRVSDFIEVTGETRLFSVLEDARSLVKGRLAAAAAESYSAAHYNATLAQVDSIMLEASKRAKSQFRLVDRVLSEQGVADTIRQVRFAENRFSGVSRVLPVKPALRFVQKAERRRSVIRGFSESIARYGSSMVGEIERVMATSTIAGINPDDAIDAVAGVDKAFEDERWKAERIWRTEGANAYEAAKLDTATHLNEAHDLELQKRLEAVFDARTGADSRYVDGQTVGLDELFQDNVGRRYARPPNRPNDRETLVYVDPEWDKQESA
jgi:hypothetical protein